MLFPKKWYHVHIVTVVYYYYEQYRGNHIWVGAMAIKEGNEKIEKLYGVDFVFGRYR